MFFKARCYFFQDLQVVYNIFNMFFLSTPSAPTNGGSNVPCDFQFLHKWELLLENT